MCWAVIGGLNFAAVENGGKIRVIKPERNFVHEVLTAAAGYDLDGEPYGCSILTTGAQYGVGRVAEAWAEKHMMGLKKFPLKPKSFGKKAPQMRLEALLGAKPDYALVFPLDKRDVAEKALVRDLEKNGVPTFHVRY